MATTDLPESAYDRVSGVLLPEFRCPEQSVIRGKCLKRRGHEGTHCGALGSWWEPGEQTHGRPQPSNPRESFMAIVEAQPSLFNILTCVACGYTIKMGNRRTSASKANWVTYCKARHAAKHEAGRTPGGRS